MMSPRNPNNTNCNNNLPSEAADDSQMLDIVPNILHKKHKVIKLVKAQLLKLQEEGLVDYSNSNKDTGIVKFQNQDYFPDTDHVGGETQNQVMRRSASLEQMSDIQTSTTKLVFLWFIILLLIIFLVLLVAAWLSAGPLSNRVPCTPISWCSLVKTDSLSELERKCLLRWSTSNFLE